MDIHQLDRTLLSNIARNTVIHDHEKEQVAACDQKYKSKRMFEFDTDTIRREKRATLLRSEFIRLIELKESFYAELDRIAASSSLLAEELQREAEQEEKDRELMKSLDPNEGAFHELWHRSKMRSLETIRYIYAKPRFMEVLERECPRLMDRERHAFRDTLTRSLLLNEDPDPTVFMVQLELLEMIENGELTQEEASMKSSKLAFDRTRLIELVGRQLRKNKEGDAEVKKLFYKSNKELEVMLEQGQVPRAAAEEAPPKQTAKVQCEDTYLEFKAKCKEQEEAGGFSAAISRWSRREAGRLG